MASLVVQRDELVVRLSGLEQLAAFRHGIRLPVNSITAVHNDPDPWCSLRGFRAPGTGIPGVIAYGVRRMTGAQPDFAALHGQGPAVRVELAPSARFGRLVVTVDDPEATVASIRARIRAGRVA